MKAVMCRQFGPPDQLVLEDLPSLVPDPGQIVVSVKAAGVNFPDCLIIQNKHQIKATPPFSPGYEFSGVVKLVGEGVTGLKVGDHGVGQVKWGAFAEEIAIPAERFWKVPSTVPFDVAAAFPLAYGTSYYALKERAKLMAGEVLVVLGAAGGIGISAVQFGKLIGATVIACASSTEKLELCAQYGADYLINYSTTDLKEEIRRITKGKGADVVLDPVGGIYAEPVVRTLTWGGRYLVVGFTGGIPKIALNLILLKSASLIGVLWDSFTWNHPVEGQRYISEMAELIERGTLEILVKERYELRDTPRALNSVLDRKVQGKSVILMEP